MKLASLHLSQAWDDLRHSLWFRPTLWLLGLGTLAILLIRFDLRYGAQVTLNRPWLFHAEGESASTILVAISSTTLTIMALVLSIIMVAVVQTANAYSPRILRTYLSDTANQHVLGVLIGTFLFCLIVLNAIYTNTDDPFIPALSVTMAVILSLLSTSAFIYFIHHVAHSIEVDNIILLIAAQSEALVTEHFPSTVGQPWPHGEPPALPTAAPAVVPADMPGYIQVIEPHALMALAVRDDLLIRVEPAVGDYILPETPLVSVWPPERMTSHLADELRGLFRLGSERTLVQDLHFQLRQIVDIALRAISPAINDPATAVNCIDALAALLVSMLQKGPVSLYRADDAGTLRVVAHGPTFENTLNLAFRQIRHYSATDYACTVRLIEACTQIGYAATTPQARANLWHHVSAVAHNAERAFLDAADRAEINQRLQQAGVVLRHEAGPLLLATPPVP